MKKQSSLFVFYIYAIVVVIIITIIIIIINIVVVFTSCLITVMSADYLTCVSNYFASLLTKDVHK